MHGMTKFNAQRARSKRPCPLWVDAFQRDTQHLEADEVGAYMLILMAMWTRETCDFPNDQTRLARVSRVSLRLWKSRIGPAIMPFLTADGDAVFSKRLRQEATYVERQVKQQSDRKASENSANSLESNEPDQSVDNATDEPRSLPSQLPNNPTYIGGGGDAGASDPPTHRESLIAAMGVDPSRPIVTTGGKSLGGAADMLEARRWAELGLSEAEQIAVIAEAMARKRDGPPMSFKYFTPAMQRFAADKASAETPLTPINGETHDPSIARSAQPAKGRQNRVDPALEQIARLAGLGAAPGYGGG
jgi:uncharacterized protein YdaU (DUF1376 family)